MPLTTKSLKLAISKAFEEGFRLRPPLKVVEWADAYRVLSKESNATGGKFYSSLAPYQREPMNAVNDHGCGEVVLMWASQTGKTEIVNNICAYHIDWKPSPILVLQPTLEMAETWSKDRLAPMLRDTPQLQGKVNDVRSRDANNTILHKRFPGGHITACGANSAASLASRPIRLVICDEVDRYPISAGSEGDPIMLARKRSESFPDSKLFITSTPTVKGFSRVEKAFDATDQRRYFLPCPKCEQFQTLKWSQLKFEKEKPEEACYVCEHCNCELSDADRIGMLQRGEWRATAPHNRKRGYHLNGLYSPFKHHGQYRNRLHQFASEYVEAAKLGGEGIRVWTNTFLAETYDDAAERLSHEPLWQRREKYGPEKDGDKYVLPDGVLVLVVGADVHPDRIEAEIVGFGLGEESWGIRFVQFLGSPVTPHPWKLLDEFLDQTFTHPRFGEMRINCAFIDSGHLTDEVYKFCKPREVKRTYACKGRGGQYVPLLDKRATRNNKARVAVFGVGTDACKDAIYARLRLLDIGPRYMHFPIGQGYDEEWFRQLVSERKTRKLINGRIIQKYEKTVPNARNEALDMRVYSYGAFLWLNLNLERYLKKLEAEPLKGDIVTTDSNNDDSLDEEKPERTVNRYTRAPRRQGGWASKYKFST